MPYYAKVILDSIGPQGNRLTTMEFTLPKLWLAEFNTHCMFARNSASTRAIPYKKQRGYALDDPFIPFEWPIEQKGMAHSRAETDPEEIKLLEQIWLAARNKAIEFCDFLAAPDPLRTVNRKFANPIHKQLACRLIEPWRFQTVLVTGDEGSYSNFFHLRCDFAAAPEIHKAADLMWTAYSTSSPQLLKEGEWHMPLLNIDDEDKNVLSEFAADGLYSKRLCEVSSARCARISYLTHDGKRDMKEDLNLFQRLTGNGHWSPLEHVCQAMAPHCLPQEILDKLDVQPKRYGKWFGWRSLRSTFPNEYVTKYYRNNH